MTKIDEVCAPYGLAQYTIAAFRELMERTSLAGKRVLEVGGSNLPRELALEGFGAREWVSVDIIAEGRYQLLQQSAHYQREGIVPLADAQSVIGSKPYLILDGAIENATALPSDYFDVVVSITSFEHILAMPSALAQMSRLKTAAGCIFSYHGPIWSSFCGHHIWVDDDINFNVRSAIPPHGHLLHSPPAMFALLVERFGALRAEAAVLQMYHQPRVNRLFYEDYESYFRLAKFSKIETTGYGTRAVAPELQARLERLHPGYRVFDAYGMIAFLR